jgi:hypothetical protein
LGQTAQTQLSRVRFSSKATALTPAPYIPFPPDRFIPHSPDEASFRFYFVEIQL